MTSKKVSCAIDTQSDIGVYANAFRVIQDGSEVILDFCLYSELENAARTVGRIRVAPSFLTVIASRIEEATESETTTGTRYLMVEPESTEQ